MLAKILNISIDSNKGKNNQIVIFRILVIVNKYFGRSGSSQISTRLLNLRGIASSVSGQSVNVFSTVWMFKPQVHSLFSLGTPENLPISMFIECEPVLNLVMRILSFSLYDFELKCFNEGFIR